MYERETTFGPLAFVGGVRPGEASEEEGEGEAVLGRLAMRFCNHIVNIYLFLAWTRPLVVPTVTFGPIDALRSRSTQVMFVEGK